MDRFDVIDTSDLAESLGMMNLLVVASPLLKATPHATLRTDLMRAGEQAKQEAGVWWSCRGVPYPIKADDNWNGQLHTVSMLLGESSGGRGGRGCPARPPPSGDGGVAMP